MYIMFIGVRTGQAGQAQAQLETFKGIVKCAYIFYCTACTIIIICLWRSWTFYFSLKYNKIKTICVYHYRYILLIKQKHFTYLYTNTITIVL